jgi:hypothetical protein
MSQRMRYGPRFSTGQPDPLMPGADIHVHNELRDLFKIVKRTGVGKVFSQARTSASNRDRNRKATKISTLRGGAEEVLHASLAEARVCIKAGRLPDAAALLQGALDACNAAAAVAPGRNFSQRKTAVDLLEKVKHKIKVGSR